MKKCEPLERGGGTVSTIGSTPREYSTCAPGCAESSLAPVLRETAKRGLIYVDDGTSPRSVAGQIAGANKIAFAKADVVIDSVPTGAEIERALGRLEAIARERGQAVGVASALPVAVDRIAKWAKGAPARGVTLVPISAVANKPKSS